jgi:phosphotransacetylase
VADTALDETLLRKTYPLSALKDMANAPILPNLNAGNIAYRLFNHLGGASREADEAHILATTSRG